MDNKISIIIPAYNIESYLSATLDSVLAQTYTNIEVIVVNDGSRDGTGAIIDAYAAKDSRIKAIHKENGGVTSARLRGVREASGDWIGFVDGDDFIKPQMYQRLLDNAKKYRADISHCGYRMVFPNGRVDYYYNTGHLAQQDTITGLKELLSGSRIEPGLWNKLFHKSLFHSLLHGEAVSAEIRINEDLLMNYYLFREARSSVYEDFCPYYYVLRPGSAATSTVNAHKLYDPLKVVEILLEETKGEPALREIVLAKQARQLIAAATMDASPNPDLIRPAKKQALRNLRKQLPVFLKNPGCGLKLKIMVLWTAIWPASYGWVHRLYERVTGLDKIYDIN